MIRDRSTMLRIHAETASLRADPEGVPVIKSLIALEALKPDLDASAFTQTKTKA